LWQPSDQRQKLIDAIEKHDVLRFVGGYPLRPDLTLKGVAQKAIEEFDANVTLATLKYDKLRGYFKSEGEARIINVMDAAYDSHKRKASEISN
jgi:hypothetical protein